MLKILLIDDNQEKRRVVTKVALQTDGLQYESFDFASDVMSAKRAISNTRYDLVILDINLPSRADEAVEVGAGIKVLQFIKKNSKAHPPAYLFGLTAYDDGAEAAGREFSSPLWKLIRFSFNDDSWHIPLREALSYLIAARKPPYPNDGLNYHYDLAVFAALPEELDSLLSLDAGWRKFEVPHDSGLYYEGVFSGEAGQLSVVATVAPCMGMPAAGVISSKLISNFRPRYLAVIGICAGVKGEANIGDVLIADPCFDWGSGKWVKDPDGPGVKFLPAAYQWRLDEPLRSVVKRTASAELMETIYRNFHGSKPSSPPKVIVGPMASGGSVLQSTALMNGVQGQHKNLIGLEMETYAVFTAAQYSAEPRPTCISMKSVCDFGDETKTDGHHAYAAFTSAAFLYEYALSNFIRDMN